MQRERLAVTHTWNADVNDPRNEVYLIPCSKDEDEEMAQMMADGIYSYIVSKQFTDDTPEATANYAYFQAVVDSRRMLADPEYAHLFGG